MKLHALLDRKRQIIALGLVLMCLGVVFSSLVSKADVQSSAGAAYRLYENQDNVAPGTPLAATNTPAQLSSTGQAFRLRTGLVASDTPQHVENTYNTNSQIFTFNVPASVNTVHAEVAGGSGGSSCGVPLCWIIGGSDTRPRAGLITADINTTSLSALYALVGSSGGASFVILGAAGGTNTASNIMTGGSGGSVLGVGVGAGGGGGGSGVFTSSTPAKTNALLVAGGAGGNGTGNGSGASGGTTLNVKTDSTSNATNGGSAVFAGFAGGGGGAGWRGGAGGNGGLTGNGGAGGTNMADTAYATNVVSTGGGYVGDYGYVKLSYDIVHPIAANESSLVLQYASKSAASCNAQTTGFANVTASTPIAWNTNGSVTNGTVITAHANDPTAAANTAHQRYISQAGNFTNPNQIDGGKTGLWDFSLKDNSGVNSASYCMRVAMSDGTPLASYTNVGEITTAAGELSLDIVDGSGDSVDPVSFAMQPTTTQTSCQTTTGTIGESNKKIRVTNTDLSVSNGWVVSMSATNVANTWEDSVASEEYDFNDPAGSPAGCADGGDGDTLAGQLRLNPTLSAITPSASCNRTGVSKGAIAGFNQGTVDALTLVQASSAADIGCYWDVENIGATQSIPGGQASGSYTIDMTVTVTAQ